MSMAYIRGYYDVPAKRGGRIEYTASNGQKFVGTIKSADGAHLRVLLDGHRSTSKLHPTWNVKYLADGAKEQK
jgi:hypothetical protein